MGRPKLVVTEIFRKHNMDLNGDTFYVCLSEYQWDHTFFCVSRDVTKADAEIRNAHFA